MAAHFCVSLECCTQRRLEQDPHMRDAAMHICHSTIYLELCRSSMLYASGSTMEQHELGILMPPMRHDLTGHTVRSQFLLCHWDLFQNAVQCMSRV
jgi:hypothetical protein